MKERVLFDIYTVDKKNNEWFQSRDKDYKDFLTKRESVYDWLYEHGELEKNCYDYAYPPSKSSIFFVMPVSVVEKFKDAMIADGVSAEVIELAISKIQPCVFCGTVSLTSTYIDYRDNGGCVGRYHSCDFCKFTESKALYEYREQVNGDPVEFAKIFLQLHREDWAKKEAEKQAAGE